MKKSKNKKELTVSLTNKKITTSVKTCSSSCPQCSKPCSLSAEHIGSHRCSQGHRWK